MASPPLGQLLGSLFANTMRGRLRAGPFGAGPHSAGGAALDGFLGSMLGRGSSVARGGHGLSGNRTLLLAMLLPYAMKWVQRSGGVRAVLERFRHKGLGPHADSWVSTGGNRKLRAEEADEVVGGEELSQVARQIGVPERDVALGYAEIVPELVDQLSPDGRVPPEADAALAAGRSELERELTALTTGAPV